MNSNKFSFILVIILLMVNAIVAQPGSRQKDRGWVDQDMAFKHGPGLFNLPDITEEQKAKMHDLRTRHMKLMLENRNQLQEKQAVLNSLETAEKADLMAINNLIDQISAVQLKMAKTKAAHRQEVRSMLSEEQRVIFDSRPRGFKNGKGDSCGKGHGHRHKRD